MAIVDRSCCRHCEDEFLKSQTGCRLFVVCSVCGNKRCPKATHHDNECTGSNEPGQKGSSWENVKPASNRPWWVAHLVLLAMASTCAASTPATAVALAHADALTYSDEAPYFRYLWFPTGEQQQHQAASYALNEIANRSGVIYRPHSIGWSVMRVDLSRLSKDEKHLEELVELWERLRVVEPYFIHHAGKRVLELRHDGYVRVRSDKPIVQNGTTYHQQWSNPSTLNLVHDFGGHVDRPLAEELADHCHTEIPIVRGEWLLRIMGSNINGGLYYEFRGIAKSKDPKVTDFDLFMQTFAGTTQRAVEEAGSDARTATAYGELPKRPRTNVWGFGTSSQPGKGPPLWAVTQDIADADRYDDAKHPILHALDAEFQASEAITTFHGLGLHAFALFDGRGNLVREAPTNVVHDYLAAHGSPPIIEGWWTCVRCHNREDHDGWRYDRNDIKALLEAGFDVIDDLAEQDRLRAVQEIARKYGGEPDRDVQLARDAYSAAILRASGGLDVREASAALTYVDDYWRAPVTAAVACSDLGISVPEDGDAAAILKTYLFDEPRGPPVVRIVDARLALLAAGRQITRVDWEDVYLRAAERVEALRAVDQPEDME